MRTNLLRAAFCAVAAAVGGVLIVPFALPLAASAQVDPFAADVAKPRAPQSAPGQPAQSPAQNGTIQSNRVGFNTTLVEEIHKAKSQK